MTSCRGLRFLPILQRELRVTVHQPKTWYRRLWAVSAALVIFFFVYFEAGQWANLSGVGSEIFTTLCGFGMVYGLLAGPLKTADCVSRERREGTLGLLFLTDLRSYEVV